MSHCSKLTLEVKGKKSWLAFKAQPRKLVGTPCLFSLFDIARLLQVSSSNLINKENFQNFNQFNYSNQCCQNQIRGQPNKA